VANEIVPIYCRTKNGGSETTEHFFQQVMIVVQRTLQDAFGNDGKRKI
jgi:hypothetical protein